jgi:CRISPR-associated protein Cas8c/Csd1, subtype I-C/DVULG
MIRELVVFGESQRSLRKKDGQQIDDAVTLEEEINVAICIRKDGSFEKLIIVELDNTPLEDILVRTSGISARLLVDNSKYVLGIGFEKKKGQKDQFETVEYPDYLSHFKERLNDLKDLPEIEPVIAFYERDEFLKARVAFLPEVFKGVLSSNLAFFLEGKYVHTSPNVLTWIRSNYKLEQGRLLGQQNDQRRRCSVCCTMDFPIARDTHGPIKRVPKAQTSGAYLISYDSNAFWSYDLIEKDKKRGKDKIYKNLNSGVCSHCAKLYREALNFLLTDAHPSTVVDKKGKSKEIKIYNHRKNFGIDTAVVYWTRDSSGIDLDILDQPDEASIMALFESVEKGSRVFVEENKFYSLTLSGAAARIVVRDYVDISLTDMKRNIVNWFFDIDLDIYDGSGKKKFPPLWRMGEGLRRPNDPDKKDETPARAQVYLWKAAIQGQKAVIPLWILARVLSRIRNDSFMLDEGKRKEKEGKPDTGLSFGNVFSSSRMALIKLVLNRSFAREEGGGEAIMNSLNESSRDCAYLSGCILALLAKIQYHAAKRDMNTSVVSKHYSSASVTPAATFGRLFKNAQNHLQKIRQDNPGLAVNLEKEVAGLCQRISESGGFPAVFTLEQQGRFALGFYQRRFKPVEGDEEEQETTAEMTTEEDTENQD